MILPVLNSICAYSFTTNFTSLNGIYTLVEMMTYAEAQVEGIDFVTYLYTPAGLTASQFTIDAGNYTTDRVIKLIPVNATPSGPSMLYVPESLVASIPDAMVSCYNNVAIGIVLGAYADQTTLAWVLGELNSILTATTGVTAPATLFSLGTQYMKISDYAALIAARAAAVAAQTPYQTLYEQLLSANKEIQSLKTLVQYYETTLITL